MAANVHNPLVISETAQSAVSMSMTDVDAAVSAVAAQKQSFASLPVRERIELLSSCMTSMHATVDEWIRLACAAKGIRADQPVAAEEWLSGPYVVLRNLRLLRESLESIERTGSPPMGIGLRKRGDGRWIVSVFPSSLIDSLLFSGFTARVWLEAGLSEADARKAQASFYKQSERKGGLSLILGAGNISSIAPMDALYKLFVEGRVAVLKMNPVNEYLGPVFEKAFAPLIRRDFLRIVYGGSEVGAHLCAHSEVDDIHITGSDRTHDRIVWGPPGYEADRRRALKQPLLEKPISSELGNISPVIVVPGPYSASELKFVAHNVATQVVHNASFNCNAAKALLLSKSWPQRDAFLAELRACLSRVPPRQAYYPGAEDRYRTLTRGRVVESFGDASRGQLPWTLITGLDPRKDEPQFATEPFCAVLSVVEFDTGDPAAFLTEAAAFANDRLWGTLNACIVLHPRTEAHPAVESALDEALRDLRYGTIAINHWPALGYGFVTTPWGGHPSSTLENIQSGLGWVHNSYMLEGIEKCVVRGPLKVVPRPPWFFDHARAHELARLLVDLELSPSLWKLPKILWTALRSGS